jgi:hypothetical protein
MRYRAGAILVKFVDVDGKHIMQRQIKLRHFRNRDGNSISDYGGHSILFDLDEGIVATSTCHPTDKFSRKAGTTVCFAKWIDIMKNDPILTDRVGGIPVIKAMESSIDVYTVTLQTVTQAVQE